MKWLCLLFFTSLTQAAVLSQYVSTVNGSAEQRFDLEKSLYEKRSNYFDSKRSLDLGTYEIRVPKSVINEVEGILKRIKASDKVLKHKKLSFNDLSEKDPHAPFILLDEFRITAGSDFYAELKKNFEKLEGLEKKNFTGIRLTNDYKEVHEFKKDELQKKEPFSFGFHCKTEQPPSVCLFKEQGILFVK